MKLEDKLTCSDMLSDVIANRADNNTSRHLLIQALKAMRRYLEDGDISKLQEAMFQGKFQDQAKLYNEFFGTNIQHDNESQFTKELMKSIWKSAPLE